MAAGDKDPKENRGEGEAGIRPRDPLPAPRPGESDLDFRYSREERLALPTAPRRTPPQSFFRRHRGVLIILADIAILAILGFVFLFFFGPPDSTGRIGAYRATLRGLRYGEALLATVSVRLEGTRGASGGGSGASAGDGRVFVRFALSRNAPDSDSYFDSAPLPGEGQSEVVLRAAIPFGDDPSRLYAEVRIDRDTTQLSLSRDAW